jgi:hypothetical protein
MIKPNDNINDNTLNVIIFEGQNVIIFFFLNIGGQCHSFYYYFFSSQIGNETSTLYIQYFALGLLGGVDVKWSGGLLVLFCTDVIVVRVKVSRGFVPLPNGDRQCGH